MVAQAKGYHIRIEGNLVRTDPDWEFQAQGKKYRTRSCRYCGHGHKESECQNITDVAERKRNFKF